MPASQDLRLPAGSSATFDACDDFNGDLGKWLVYTIKPTLPGAAEELCYEAMKAYNDEHLHEPESEWEDMGFIRPADENTAAEDIQAILEKHIAMVQEILERNEEDPWNLHRLHPYGFVVIDREDWREKGLVAVHCDKDEEGGDWGVLRSRFRVKDLGFVLTTVQETDDTFEREVEIHGMDST